MSKIADTEAEGHLAGLLDRSSRRKLCLDPYDMVYLDLAPGLALPLAARDKALIVATKAVGVALLETD